MPSAQNKIQIVDTHETSETLAVTRLQRVGYQINRTLLKPNNLFTHDNWHHFGRDHDALSINKLFGFRWSISGQVLR